MTTIPNRNDQALWHHQSSVSRSRTRANRSTDKLRRWPQRNYNVVAPTDRQIAARGVELSVAEPCFPVQVAHGHIRWLIEHGADLCSCDTDFARFAGLRWLNPLAA